MIYLIQSPTVLLALAQETVLNWWLQGPTRRSYNILIKVILREQKTRDSVLVHRETSTAKSTWKRNHLSKTQLYLDLGSTQLNHLSIKWKKIHAHSPLAREMAIFIHWTIQSNLGQEHMQIKHKWAGLANIFQLNTKVQGHKSFLKKIEILIKILRS